LEPVPETILESQQTYLVRASAGAMQRQIEAHSRSTRLCRSQTYRPDLHCADSHDA